MLLLTNCNAVPGEINLMLAIGGSLTTISGNDISFNLSTSAQGVFKIRYRYKWCPTPAASASNQRPSNINGCTADSSARPNWQIPICGDGFKDIDRKEECD
eukprot:Awhi_evm1s10156